MGHRPDGLSMPETRYGSAINSLEDTSLGFNCRVRRLIENAPHVPIAHRRPVAVVHTRALIVARAYTHPRREVLLGAKGCCRGTHFGDDLLRLINAQTAHFRQSLHCILMLAEQTGHFLVELADLLVDQSQLLEHHLQQPPIDAVELCALAKRVTQLFWRGTQLPIGQRRQVVRLFSPSSSALSIRHALAPSRSETKLDNLMCASSSRDSSRFCNCTRCASADTFGASPSATDAVRHLAQSSRSARVPPAASPSVRHRVNLSSALAARGSTAPAPGAAFPTSGLRLPASGALEYQNSSFKPN